MNIQTEVLRHVSFQDVILPKLKEYFLCEVDYAMCDPNKFVIRSNLKTKQDAEKWLRIYEETSQTRYLVLHESKKTQRIVFSMSRPCSLSHTGKKKGKSARNTECPCVLKILIKKLTPYTMRRDAVLRSNPYLTGVIKIISQHNHHTNCADSLRLLRIGTEVEEQFYKYFDMGMAASEARHLHECKIMLDENSHTKLANASVNPSARTILYLHDKWRKKYDGSVISPLKKIVENMNQFAKQGATVVIEHNQPWCILVVTSVMKRAQYLKGSREVIYIDSMSSGDTLGSNITIFLTPTKAGSIPIAVLVHENQTVECFEKSFRLFQENFPKAFGTEHAPQIFMTDDLRPQKLALSMIWPLCRQLLCHTHICQAEWTWLIGAENGINPIDRLKLMNKFQKVVYSIFEIDFNKSVHELLTTVTYPNYIQRFRLFLNRKEEWCSLYRQGVVIKNHHTKSFAEVTMGILRGIILHQTRAFNAAALVDYFTCVWNQYLISKLMVFASNRSEAAVKYVNIVRKIENNDASKIKRDPIQNNIFHMDSVKTRNTCYEVNANIGVCTCPAGQSGEFCKHQENVSAVYNIVLPNMPSLSDYDRYEIADLALGESCPEISFFCGTKDNMNVITNPDMLPDYSENSIDNNEDHVNNCTADYENFKEKKDAFELAKNELEMEIIRLKTLLTPETPLTYIKQLTANLKLLVSSAQLAQAIENVTTNYVNKSLATQKQSIKDTYLYRKQVKRLGTAKGKTKRKT